MKTFYLWNSELSNDLNEVRQLSSTCSVHHFLKLFEYLVLLWLVISWQMLTELICFPVSSWQFWCPCNTTVNRLHVRITAGFSQNQSVGELLQSASEHQQNSHLVTAGTSGPHRLTVVSSTQQLLAGPEVDQVHQTLAALWAPEAGGMPQGTMVTGTLGVDNWTLLGYLCFTASTALEEETGTLETIPAFQHIQAEGKQQMMTSHYWHFSYFNRVV